MMGWFTKHFGGLAPEPALMDHCPVNVTTEPTAEQKAIAPGEGLTHEAKLRLAAERAGKPFRCATDGLPREVIKNGAPVTVGVKPKPLPEPPPNVRTIRKARA